MGTGPDPDTPDVAALIVELVLLDLTTGLWCDRCQLPSLIEARFALVDPDTLQHGGTTTTHRHCTDCGAS